MFSYCSDVHPCILHSVHVFACVPAIVVDIAVAIVLFSVVGISAVALDCVPNVSAAVSFIAVASFLILIFF